jgi:uncharacterized protein YndB with AHSA1/START domain
MLKLRLDASADDVWHALTDAGELRRWFAEDARVHLPDTYEFWGRYTPDGAEPHQRLLRADDHTLRFAWQLDGTDTEVEISLAPESDKSTILTLTQTNLPSFADIIAGANVLGMIYTFWTHALANLADHVAGRALTGRCDYTTNDMRAEILIDANRHAVFESLANPAIFGEWFGISVEAEPGVGGRWAMGKLGEVPTARIVRLDDDAAMALEWPDGMVATWELADSDGRTKLTYVHSGFDDPNEFYPGWAGTLAGLAELRRYHELPNWRPMWLAVRLEGAPEQVTALDR